MRHFLLLLFLLLTACTGVAQPQVGATLGAVEAMNIADTTGFARAETPRPFVFPDDHRAHPEFLTEWWYFTGNLKSANGQHFGYQFTIFRRALSANAPARESDWATQQIYMGHLALSNVVGEEFYAFERFSRDGAGLAGSGTEPFQIFVEDWSIQGSGPAGMAMDLRAADGPISLDLRAESTREPVLQGDAGLSQKGPSLGNASYYYSLTRMQTSGEIQIGEQRYKVDGLSWMDHEWSTSALEGDMAGWDWFALQLDDGSDLMLYQIRKGDGSPSDYRAGTLVQPDGTVVHLEPGEMQLRNTAEWASPHTAATYPAAWQISIPSQEIELEIQPYLADQELLLTVTYWEGAVQVRGQHAGVAVNGNGYVELTGYVIAQQGRF